MNRYYIIKVKDNAETIQSGENKGAVIPSDVTLLENMLKNSQKEGIPSLKYVDVTNEINETGLTQNGFLTVIIDELKEK